MLRLIRQAMLRLIRQAMPLESLRVLPHRHRRHTPPGSGRAAPARATTRNFVDGPYMLLCRRWLPRRRGTTDDTDHYVSQHRGHVLEPLEEQISQLSSNMHTSTIRSAVWRHVKPKQELDADLGRINGAVDRRRWNCRTQDHHTEQCFTSLYRRSAIFWLALDRRTRLLPGSRIRPATCGHFPRPTAPRFPESA
jgi:hypothetical protein